MSTQSSSLFKAWATSGAIHGLALGLLAIGGARIARVEMTTRSGQLQLQASFSAETPAPTEAEVPNDVEVIVMPQSVQLAEQSFRFEPTEPVSTVDIDTPRAMSLAKVSPARKHSPRLQSPRLKNVEVALRPRKKMEQAVVTDNSQLARPVGERAAVETVAPNFHNNPPPVYPSAAFAAKIEGTVLLRFTVSVDGRVSNVVVDKSSGHPILDGAAVNAVKRWHGLPATRNGVPIETTETLPVRFQLR